MPRRNKSARRKKPEGPVFARHPFADLDPSILKEALASAAERRVAEFPSLLSRFSELFTVTHPLSLLSMIAGWGMTATVDDSGVSDTGMLEGILQHHIELLQALVLRQDPATWGSRPATPAHVQSAIDDIQELANAFHERRFLQLTAERSVQEHVVLSLQERLRGHTQIVRNWGYPAEVRRISRGLFSSLDPELEKRHGFGASDLISVAEALDRVIGRRLHARFSALQRIFRQKSIRQLVRIYFRDYPNVEGDPEEFLSIIPAGTTLLGVRSMLLSHADLSFFQLFVVTVPDIATEAAVSEAVAASVLDHLSQTPGDLRDNDPEHLFLANPVWLKPGIRLNSDYFFGLSSVIFSFILPIVRDLCDTPDLKKALEKRRSAYLEEQIEIAVRAALPSGRVQTNVAWVWDGQQFETDLVLTLDRIVLIVEAKSASLTDQGLRGAPDRVRRHVQDLIVAPAAQSARLARLVVMAREGNEEAKAAISHFHFDPAEVDHVARLSVTLDDFSVLASAEEDLRTAGWIPTDLMLAPTLNLADLLVVLEILSSPIIILDYLLERERLQKTLLTMGDELDHLGLYLDTGFNFGVMEDELSMLAISGMSEPLDKYYTSLDAGVALPKPTLKLSPYFRKAVETLEARAGPGWTTIGFALLHLGNPREQKSIETALEKLRRSVPKTHRDPAHLSSIVIKPPRPRDFLGVFYVHTTKSGTDHRDTASLLAAQAMESEGFDRCLTVIRFVEDWDTPYRSIGLMTAA